MVSLMNFGRIELGCQVLNTVSGNQEKSLKTGVRVNDFVFTIRHNVVEKIYYKFNNVVDENTIPEGMPTIGSSYGSIIGEKYYTIGNAFTEEDVVKISNQIKMIFVDYFKPRLEKYSDIFLLEKEFNKDPDVELPFSPIYWRGRRAMRGIILAKLCHNPRYDELKSIYRQKCIEQDDSEILDAYDKLVYYLDNEYEKE